MTQSSTCPGSLVANLSMRLLGISLSSLTQAHATERRQLSLVL
jgi:hypothetical protein